MELNSNIGNWIGRVSTVGRANRSGATNLVDFSSAHDEQGSNAGSRGIVAATLFVSRCCAYL